MTSGKGDVWENGSVSHPVRAVVSDAAIRRNVAALRARTAAAVMAVVKADAYGHGARHAARAAVEGGATWLGIAQVEEAVARIQSMTKEAEVGDRYTAAKVVKTTTFGAFVELTKGTDGLLHISNVKPGGRVETVEEVLEQGQEIDVTVAEVDRERGRIGLRMTDDPAIAGKSPEEIAALASSGGGGGRGGREGGGRGGDREGGRRRRDRCDRDRR